MPVRPEDRPSYTTLRGTTLVSVGHTQVEPLAGAHAGQRSLRKIAAKLAVKGYVNAKGRAFPPLSPKVIIDAWPGSDLAIRKSRHGRRSTLGSVSACWCGGGVLSHRVSEVQFNVEGCEG